MIFYIKRIGLFLFLSLSQLFSGCVSHVQETATTVGSLALDCPEIICTPWITANGYLVNGCGRDVLVKCDGTQPKSLCKAVDEAVPSKPRQNENPISVSGELNNALALVTPIILDCFKTLEALELPLKVKIADSGYAGVDDGIVLGSQIEEDSLVVERECANETLKKMSIPSSALFSLPSKFNYTFAPAKAQAPKEVEQEAVPKAEEQEDNQEDNRRDLEIGLRNAVNSEADDILTCADAENIALEISYEKDGTATVTLRQEKKDSPEEGCIKHLLRDLSVPEGLEGKIIHLVRQ